MKEIAAKILLILKGEMKDKNIKEVKIIGIGPAYIVVCEDGQRILSDTLPKEILEKTFPAFGF
jgi:hypothetical protein